MTTEFSHIVKLSELGSDKKSQKVTADDSERKALAKRFDLPAILELTAIFSLLADDSKIHLTGTLNARLEQSCVISDETFPVTITEKFEIIFVPETEIPVSEEEIELAADDCDIIEYEGNNIDIGEAIAQTLYLSLDPFPRGPNADIVAEKKGLKSEEEAGPFGALAALKDKLG
ncbi:MAG: DUF177 domain-containing protein [Parasphingorhabdus sp.]